MNLKTDLKIILKSYGLKSGQPLPPADCYIDCRGVPDPSQAIGGSGLGFGGNGDLPAVQTWIASHIVLLPYREIVGDHLSKLSTRRGVGHEYDKPFIILTMCAHGIHRSRAMKHILARELRGVGYQHVRVE